MSNDTATGPRDSLGPTGPGDEILEPDHYRWIPNIECKDVVKYFPFMLGNAIKYIWRAGRKGDKLKDLRKARECLDNEIRDLEAAETFCTCPANHPRINPGYWICTNCNKPNK